MKGMQKIKRGTGFRGVCEYVLEDGRGTIIGGNMVGVTPVELAAEFGQSRKVREDIEKPIWHNSLRLPANEQISSHKWNEIADDYMKKMGFGDLHQRLYVLHDDLEGQHIHIIASRIDLTGKLYLGQNENLKSTQYIYQLEKDHNLVITQLEQEPDAQMLRKRPPKSGEIGLAERTGEIPPRLQIQAIIDFAGANYPNFSQFVDRIHYAGVSIILSGMTGTPQGISFGMNGQAFKGSGLGKSYAWKQLQDRIDYIPERDQFMIDYLRSKAVKIIGSEIGLENEGYEPTQTDQDHLKNILAKNEVVINERKNSKTEGAILGSGATKNDGERIGGLGGANGDRPEPYSGTDGTSDRSSHESECRVKQNTVAPNAVPATATDDLRSTDFAVAFGFGINRRDISSIRDVAVQLSDLAASISENRDAESASGKERPNTIRPITKEHAAKITAWEKQSEALGAEKYRITLKPRAEKDRNGRKLFDQNYGNTGNKSDRDAVGISEKFWTKDEITVEIAKLRTKNARGYDIYLTPIDDSKHFIVVDDMSPDKEKALLDAGIKPAIIQRSSANNKQAIVVIDRVKRPNEQKLANLLVETFARPQAPKRVK
jgi:hypothetical protein